MPDEARSNVYKLFRATRVAPDNSIDPKLQLAFYDAGLGARGEGDAIKITWLRRLYNVMSKATGLGITQNIIDCYTEIIRVWQPGDRIYLFGFSRGAYTARCVGGVLKACGVPTAVRQPGGRVRPLRRDARSARRIATEAVKHVYQFGGSIKGDPYRSERAKRAARFRHKYFSGDATVSNTAPYFIGAWDTVQTLGAGTRGLLLLATTLRSRVRGHRRSVRRVDGDGLPCAVPAARRGAAARALCRGLHALQGARQPGQIPPGVLRHQAQLRRALCAPRARHRRGPGDLRLRPLGRGAVAAGLHRPARLLAGALQAGLVCRQSLRRRRQLPRDGIAPLRHRARLDDAGSDAACRTRSTSIPPRSGSIPTAPVRSTTSARPSSPPARAGLRTVRCGSSTPSTSGGGKSTVASPRTRCCTPRCSSGCGCRRS